MNRPTFEDFKKKALKKSGVKEAFDKLELEYELKLKLIKMLRLLKKLPSQKISF